MLYPDVDPRLAELAAWAVEAGRPLPMPAAAIIAQEDRGNLVDLLTGKVLAGGSSRATPTPTAKAILHLTQGEGDPCPTR